MHAVFIKVVLVAILSNFVMSLTYYELNKLLQDGLITQEQFDVALDALSLIKPNLQGGRYDFPLPEEMEFRCLCTNCGDIKQKAQEAAIAKKLRKMAKKKEKGKMST
ncbi:unnamed protein product [Owenia fusiformis]|uniref:Uncharacterized protein n=1 Tax=Owenia fusiformis TaxID=6347 RepID=A0A8J1UKK2_OWEFU|nr:unnamed protein product [Owenia fusiformis]